MVHTHYNVLSKRYKDATDLLKKSGAGWNPETNMVELSSAIWKEMAEKQTGTNKRLGWFRRNPFPLYNAVGAIVDPGMAKGSGKVDLFAPENNAVKDAGKSKEDDSSSGKSMSHDGSQDGSILNSQLYHTIDSDDETPAPTSTATQAAFQPGN